VTNDRDGEAAERAEATSVPPWTTGTRDDVRAVDFEAPIRDVPSADYMALRDAYQAAWRQLEGDDSESPSSRILLLLADITSMHLNSEPPHDPFAPMMEWGDGRRTAILSDFKPCIDVLADLAVRASHPDKRAPM